MNIKTILTSINMSTVKTQDLNWKELVRKRWGKEWDKPEVAYEFSNGRKFNEPNIPEIYIPRWDTTPDTWDQWTRWA